MLLLVALALAALVPAQSPADSLTRELAHQCDANVASLLGALTVHTAPMLDPDGAERWTRRNTQGTDIFPAHIEVK